MESFRAFRIYQEDGVVEARLEATDLDSLSPGNVVIRAVWSDVNYKDALAATGKGRILKLSEVHDGGFSEYVRVPGDWIVSLPEGLSLRDAMALGTAGFTAGIAVDRMEHNGQSPNSGPILVNGATGGVGSYGVHRQARCRRLPRGPRGQRHLLSGRGGDGHASTRESALGRCR